MTRQELAELGLEHLIGTDLLRAYMHGYFMDNKLYERSKAVAKPTMYEEYQKEKNRQREQNRKEKRITMKQKKPMVNAELAQKWENGNKQVDERFSALFQNSDYQIDTTSEEFQRSRIHLARKGASKGREEDSEEEMLAEDFDLLDTNDVSVEKKESHEESESDEVFESKKERQEKERIKPKVRFFGVKQGNKIQIPTNKSEMKKEAEKRKEKRTMSLGQRARVMEKKRR